MGAYSNDSDDDEPSTRPDPEIPQPKRPRRQPEYPTHDPYPIRVDRRIPSQGVPRTGAPAPGRYVSKRERAMMASQNLLAAANSNSNPNPERSLYQPSNVLGDISDYDLPSHIRSLLRQPRKGYASAISTAQMVPQRLRGHKKPVNTIQWSQSHAHLLASASLDNHVCIWNVWSKQVKKASVFSYHNAAVKDIQWSPLGQFILSCGFDCSSRLVDVEKGIETRVFKEEQVITVVKFHPVIPNLFLSGGSRGLLKLWDIRTGTAVHEYVRSLGSILDVEFMADGKQFISSSDESGSRISENSLIVWDIPRQIPLSNQVYAEAYTCPCLRRHPSEPYFVAQSNGNYIAIFSTKHPFRLDKCKRFESHGVFGFPVKCEFSPDGRTLASGSSDGDIYFYDAKSSNVIRKIKAHDQPCIDVAFHPIMPNVIASCSWSGDIVVFE
ncbi:hypothetical protein Droror1_Dr00014210 [Drosera rotundifolia]